MSEIPTHEKVSLFLTLKTEHDDCGSGQHNCDENAICTNTVQGHSCTCKPGYVGNGTICRGRLAALGARLPVSSHPARVIGAPITDPFVFLVTDPGQGSYIWWGQRARTLRLREE